MGFTTPCVVHPSKTYNAKTLAEGIITKYTYDDTVITIDKPSQYIHKNNMIQTILPSLCKTKPLLILSNNSRLDTLTNILKSHTIPFEEILLYSTVPCDPNILCNKILNSLNVYTSINNQKDYKKYIFFIYFSPNNVLSVINSLRTQTSEQLQFMNTIYHIAIGNTTASSIRYPILTYYISLKPTPVYILSVIYGILNNNEEIILYRVDEHSNQ